MSDIRFACPRCQQHIQAESTYAGVEIACPACSAKMIVPGQPVAQVMATPPVPIPVSATTSASGCPSCGAALPRGAILCTKCGYNLATKQRTVAGRPTAPGRAMAPSGDVPWYKTPYPYVGALAVAFAVLYFLARGDNPLLKLPFFCAALLYALTARIVVSVVAFKESIGRGFLCLCIEIYTIYYVFKISDSVRLKAMYGLVLLLWLALYTFKE